MSGWQSIETAPRDGTEIIAYFGMTNPKYAESVRWSHGQWAWAQDGDYPLDGPTHWMPLPPPPEVGK